MTDDSLEACAITYAKLCEIEIDLNTPLGHGTDGSVWTSDRRTAVKALSREHNYRLEKACYERFRDAGVRKIEGFSVPQLRGFSDTLRIIEMRIVTAPYILDFGKVSIDKAPDYDPERLEELDREHEERFGPRYWPKVRDLLLVLKYTYHITI